MHLTAKTLWQGLPGQVHDKLLRLQEAVGGDDAGT